MMPSQRDQQGEGPTGSTAHSPAPRPKELLSRVLELGPPNSSPSELTAAFCPSQPARPGSLGTRSPAGFCEREGLAIRGGGRAPHCSNQVSRRRMQRVEGKRNDSFKEQMA